MGHRRWIFVLIVVMPFVVLVSCKQPDPVPPPPTSLAATGAPVPTLEPAEPVSTSAPAVVVTVEQTFPATDAPQPTATIIAPTATPAPINLLSAGDFGDNRNPLTGEEVVDPAQLDRRPLAIKISNAPPKWVRPQSGLNDADLVFEHITEARITRFTIIVYGQSPPDVGPIRSARLIDLEIPAMYNTALVYSGSSDGVRQKLLNSDFRPRILFGGDGYYRTGADKPIEHTLYGNPELFWEALESKGANQRPTFQSYMSFSSEPPPGGQPAGEAIIDYDWTLINWRYEPDTGRYQRWTDGEPHLDGNTNEQVNAANVVVILANHIEDPTICEQVINGVCTAYSVQPILSGTGPAVIFRDGLRYDATWNRAGRYDMLTFTDANGQALPLQIGNTWFQVIPIWYENPVTINP